MENLIGLIVLAFVVFLFARLGNNTTPARKRPIIRPANATRRTPTAKPKRTPIKQRVLRGKAYVIDGDSLVIDKQELRLFGVDAPEFNHPWGKKAKWHMVSLCKGHVIEATVTDVDHFDRVVAVCRLPDGRDLSEEMVKAGLALDWPKFSGGVYRHFEPSGVRKRLWLADARQKGRMHVWRAYEAKQKANQQTR